MSDDLSNLIKAQVGSNGDLYLSPRQTHLLLRWLESVERTFAQQNLLITELQNILKMKPGGTNEIHDSSTYDFGPSGSSGD